MSDHALMDLPLDAALIVKRRAGEAKYGTDPSGANGKPKFLGDPLKELHDELLDGLNYCDYAVRMGYGQGRIGEIALLLRVCRDIAQEEYRHQGGLIHG